MRFVAIHSHGYEKCPARGVDTLKQFNELISDSNARKHRVEIIDRYVDEDCTTVGKSEHVAYFLVEASSKEEVEEFFNPIGVKVRPVVEWSRVQRELKL